MKGLYIEDNILKHYIGEETRTRVDLTPNLHLKEVAADAFPLDRIYIIKLGYFTNANREIYPETTGLNETFMAFMTFLAKLGDKEKEHFVIELETAGAFRFIQLAENRLIDEFELLENYEKIKDGLKRIRSLYACDCNAIDDNLLEKMFPHLISVHISGDAQLNAHIFEGLNNLDSLCVMENKHFTSIDGALFSRNLAELIFYPKGKLDEVFTLPYDCKRILTSAFRNVRFLTTLICLDDITLEERCIDNCDRLVKVLLVGSENELANNCIVRCGTAIAARPNLEKIAKYCESNCFKYEDIKEYRNLYIDALKLNRYADMIHFQTAQDAFYFMENHPAIRGSINECLRLEIISGTVDSLDIKLQLWPKNVEGIAVHDVFFDIRLPADMLEIAIIMTAERLLRKYGKY